MPTVQYFSHRPHHNTTCILPDGSTIKPSLLLQASSRNNTFSLPRWKQAFLSIWRFHLKILSISAIFTVPAITICIVSRCVLKNVYLAVLVDNHVIWTKAVTKSVVINLDSTFIILKFLKLIFAVNCKTNYSSGTVFCH